MRNKEIVKYHNDLNTKIVFPKFMEQEQNIFFHVITRLKEQETNTLKFTASEVASFFGNNYDYGTLGWMLPKMAERMIRQGFKYTEATYNEKLKTETLTTSYITFFPTFKVELEKKPKDSEYPKLISLEVRINDDLIYLLNQLQHNFTRFELSEFTSLSGTYTKTLYRLLKQFRQTGWAMWDWESFKELMNIPKALKMCDIDKDYLKPALKELGEPRHLFNQERTIFKNLTLTKLSRSKKKCNKGDKVCYIKFEWEKEEVQKELLMQKLKKIREHEEIPTDLFYKANNYFIEYHLDKKYISTFSDTDDRACVLHLINPINETYINGKQEYQLTYNFYYLDENNEIQVKQGQQTYTSLIHLLEKLDNKAERQNTEFANKVKQSKLGEVL